MNISRKQQPNDSWLLISFWHLVGCVFFCLLRNKYAFYTVHSSDVQLNLQPHKIGIFVDFENGQVHCGNLAFCHIFYITLVFVFLQVSFYNVNARIHIYTFNDSFSESIYPFFSPCSNKYGKNDEPLTITPVNVMEWPFGFLFHVNPDLCIIFLPKY